MDCIVKVVNILWDFGRSLKVPIIKLRSLWEQFVATGFVGGYCLFIESENILLSTRKTFGPRMNESGSNLTFIESKNLM